jgi:uncharacterized protein YjbI with pentapeptide repeats
MANDEHVALLKGGVAAWNEWREEKPDIRPDLTFAVLPDMDLSVSEADIPDFWTRLGSDKISDGVDLRDANLGKAALCRAKLSRAWLSNANLAGADLEEADLRGAKLDSANLADAILLRAKLQKAYLTGAYLVGAKFQGADLAGANLSGADLEAADLSGVNLSRARLDQAYLVRANLEEADLRGAKLDSANLHNAKLSRANLGGASLITAALVGTDLTEANLTDCRIHGVSAWGLKLEGAKQRDLVITPAGIPAITVDNIEVAQFIYLLLNNQKIREVIDTITSKAVLILGRFTDERKAVLDALREELRKRDYLPILFDFDKPASQDLTATVSTLAHLARFVIADLTDPSCIPYELATVVSTTPVPVQPILLSGRSEFAMFQDLRLRYHWVLTTHRYDSQMQLIADVGEKVIAPAEGKVKDLRRRMIEAELTKPGAT